MMNKWVTDITVLNPTPYTYDWLTKPYILSQALKRIYQNLTVSLLDQGYKHAYQDECEMLNLLDEMALVRHVLLRDKEQTLTCGRVVIPKKTASLVPELNHLGSKLIGESLLYHNPNVRRSQFEFAHLDINTPVISQLRVKESLWARRSVFYINAAPLLVTDIFLPNLKPYVSLPSG